MHQLVGKPLTIAVATEKCLKELPNGHGIHPQVIPAFCTAQLDGAFDTELGFDNSSNLFSFIFLIQGKNDFDPGWNISACAMRHTTITKPASEQIAQFSIENQAIMNLVVCSPIRYITVIAACGCFKELAVLRFMFWDVILEGDYVGRAFLAVLCDGNVITRFNFFGWNPIWLMLQMQTITRLMFVNPL